MTHQAENDLVEIWLNIARDNLKAADAMADRLEARLNRLADYPELGPARDDIRRGARHLVETPYLILYEWKEVEREVEIVRIVHGERDLSDVM
jgi:toxin ParE1/3/4